MVLFPDNWKAVRRTAIAAVHWRNDFLSVCSSVRPTVLTGLGYKAFSWFSEFWICSCSPLLPGFACSIHATWAPPFSRGLYCPRAHPQPCRRRCLGASIMTALPPPPPPLSNFPPSLPPFKSHNMQRKFQFWCLHKPSLGRLENFALIFCDFWSKVSAFPSLLVRVCCWVEKLDRKFDQLKLIYTTL